MRPRHTGDPPEKRRRRPAVNRAPSCHRDSSSDAIGKYAKPAPKARRTFKSFAELAAALGERP